MQMILALVLAVELLGPAAEVKPWLKSHGCRPLGSSWTVTDGNAYARPPISGDYETAKLTMRAEAHERGASHVWIKRKRSVTRTDGTAIHWRVAGRAYKCREE